MREILGLHAPVQGATDAFKQARDNIGASCVLWTAAEGPQDATEGVTNLVRLPTPHKGESAQTYLDRVHYQIAAWYASGIPAIFIPGNEPDLAESSGDVPEAWTQAEWEGAMLSIVPALREAWSGIVLGAPAYSIGNMGWYSLFYAGYFNVVTAHCYWWANKDEMTDAAAGGAWKHAYGLGKPLYVTEVNSNPTTPAQLASWVAGLPDGVKGVCFYIADDNGHDPNYNITPDDAANIRLAFTQPIPDPAPPPPTPDPPPTENPYAYDGDYAYATFLEMVDGPLAQKNPSVTSRENYLAVHRASKARGVSVATLLGWIVAENVDPALIAINNLAGIKYVGQSRAYKSDVLPPPSEQGVYAGFHTLDDFWETLAINIDSIDPDAWARGDLATIAHIYTGGAWGEAKVGIVDGLRAYPHGTLETGGTQPSSGITLEDIYQQALARVGNDHTDEGSAEFGMCEQNREEEEQAAGLPRVRYATAAQHGDALTAAGKFRQGRAPRGAGLVWGVAFDPQGHICTAADYPMVITTHVSGKIAMIDAVANGWYASPGYLGYYIPDGASIQEDDMALPLDGKADDGVWAHGWAVAMHQADNKINRTGIFNHWLALVKQGVPVGVPICDEYGFPDGRVCQNFSSGAVLTAIPNPETNTYDVFVN